FTVHRFQFDSGHFLGTFGDFTGRNPTLVLNAFKNATTGTPTPTPFHTKLIELLGPDFNFEALASMAEIEGIPMAIAGGNGATETHYNFYLPVPDAIRFVKEHFEAITEALRETEPFYRGAGRGKWKEPAATNGCKVCHTPVHYLALCHFATVFPFLRPAEPTPPEPTPAAPATALATVAEINSAARQAAQAAQEEAARQAAAANPPAPTNEQNTPRGQGAGRGGNHRGHHGGNGGNRSRGRGQNTGRGHRGY
ncbi:hypothetical protein DL93DRAFT_2173902, partial [Clavulina sp. PMI_390]